MCCSTVCQPSCSSRAISHAAVRSLTRRWCWLPKQHNSRGEKELLDQDATPADWKPAKRRQKDQDASWTKKHGKSYFGYKLSVNVDNKYKLIRKFETDTASTHDSQHFDVAPNVVAAIMLLPGSLKISGYSRCP